MGYPHIRRYWYHRMGEGRDFHISLKSFVLFVSFVVQLPD